MAEIPRSECILGGQKSGKSRRAEALALQWLGAAPDHAALLIATALPGDAEMDERIARHQRDRAERVPGLKTLEVPLDLGAALQMHSTPQTLLVVDCLTLWLTNLLMPAQGLACSEAQVQAAIEALLQGVQRAHGPVVLVGNEIGLGVIPIGGEVRGFVDTLGRLNQSVASACDRVVFMAAGLPLVLKGTL
jgi:adenosylcobinamide kinase / adenosylcobinamide-phosphate guanylyltransferase